MTRWSDLRGMFALALWDGRRGRLLLARDRFGQKPLYYYQDRKLFVFASEIKAILAHPEVPVRFAFCQLRTGARWRLSELRLCAGARDRLRRRQDAGTGDDAASRSLTAQCATGATGRSPAWPRLIHRRSAAKCIGGLREQLEEAVKLRLVSDVPLGAFLSGGLDSSLIVALMRKHSNAAVKTFSIGFEGDDSFDETPYAEKVARHLDTEHTAFRVQPEALSLLPELVWHHDQPFADSSAIPTYLVSKLTREQVTVALTAMAAMSSSPVMSASMRRH